MTRWCVTHQSGCQPPSIGLLGRHVSFASKGVQIGPKWEGSGSFFRSDVYYILAQLDKNVLESDLQRPGFFPFWANLNLFSISKSFNWHKMVKTLVIFISDSVREPKSNKIWSVKSRNFPLLAKLNYFGDQTGNPEPAV